MHAAMYRSALVTLFTASFAMAGPFVNINFDADTAGSAPGTAGVSNLPITKPSAIGGYTATTTDIPPTAANGTLVVDDAPGISKGAVLTTNPANAVTGALWLDTLFSYTSQRVILSFDLNVADAPTAATVQPKTLDGAGSVGILLGMNASTNAGWAFRFAVAPTSESGGVFAIRSQDNSDLQSFFTYVEGETHRVTLDADYTTGLVTTYVDDVATGSLSFWTAGVSNVTTNEFFFHLNGETGNANSVVLDNIVAIPEPATLGLLAMGATGLLRRKRR